ncbi:MAG TPA: hypothetical protein VGB68_07005 [Pyrinomonadaceae bacterium]|jgi:hypothetical protein
MTFKLKTYSLFLVVILWGTLLGGVTYSHLVYFPVYLSALPDSSVVVNGTYGLRDAVFWTRLHPVLILSLVITLALNWKLKARRGLIITTIAVYAAVLAATFLYFVPELMAFQDSPNSAVSPAEWFERGQRWQIFSWIRGAAMYAAILPLLMALTNPEDGVLNSQDARYLRREFSGN